MSSTFSTNLNLQYQGTGDNTNTWGALLNTAVFANIDQALGGPYAANVAGSSDVTLSQANALNLIHNLTGILTGNINYIFPASAGRIVVINNATTGAFTVTVKASGGTGVVVTQGTKQIVLLDSTANTASVLFAAAGTLTGATLAANVLASSLTSVGTITSGIWNAGAVTSSGAVTATQIIPTGSSVPANGMYLPTTNTLGWGAGGSYRLSYDNSALRFSAANPGIAPSSSNSGIQLADPGATAASISSSGATTTTVTHWQFVNGNGNVGNITTNASATAFNTSSDKRLKENPVPIADSGAIIDALEPVKFRWKTQEGNIGYGVLAQDAYEIFPNAVTVGNDKEPNEEGFMGWSVDYSQFVPLLLAETKALRQRITTLEGL